MRTKDESKEILIRDKAIEMIVNEGFDGLSMHKLAKAANISAATIYIYYKNREDLLNKLFAHATDTFMAATLQDFIPETDFESGLWKQWNNRLQHIIDFPLLYKFLEQFKSSPLIKKQPSLQEDIFRAAMKRFVEHAVEKKQIIELPLEVFWALAYGSFYTLVKFHLENATMSGRPFEFNQHLLKLTFQQTLKALVIQ
ncbi:TetR/AcrR family transcriptional regulator [Chitinophaga silvatica]|uniref:TetR/AcrR family transcriptional regulator n=1 Tax=Chitinophaga silvatica TaxID=2282649 RepID=A0A3E1YG67_9BACT|nr:TetR/AcrR family transcriptional regulator [Chitinophaga silvatica]RFS26391.1 TetR/AcrR family transcriptional regulator [Chitinophaga silvatica]